MTSLGKKTISISNLPAVQSLVPRLLSLVVKVGFFIWHYFEMMLAMGVGAYLFELLVEALPNATAHRLGLHPGTFRYISGISLAMMVVMVTWMLIRGHGWRHSAEMSVAMLLPVGLVALVALRNGNMAWFDDTYCSAMCCGMLAAMAYRYNHFTRWSFRSAHHHH